MERRCKSKYLRSEGNRLDSLKKCNPRQFYKLFSKKKTRINKVTLDEFYDHFSNINSTVSETNVDKSRDYNNIDDVALEELNCEITVTERAKVISSLKREKAHGPDSLLNEYFIEHGHLFIHKLHQIFNSILSTGFFPKSWSSAMLVPVFKKGDDADPNNYRGISLVSCFAKLFTSIINQRLILWASENDIITDAQFGFQPSVSTVDAIFALYALIDKSLACNKRLYCAFIDFKRAFDSINRYNLWYKLSYLGIRGKLMSVIYSLYSNVRTCVSLHGRKSSFFRNVLGLMQGEVMSPILYSLYVNDFEMNFLKDGCVPFECKSLSLFLLMYADDLVLFSETVDGLQGLLNSLHSYSKNWSLDVNIQKSKIVVFRKGGHVKSSERWFYNGTSIDVVDKFTYLGIVFNFNNKFNVAEKQLSDQGRKAAFSVNSNIKSLHLNPESLLSVFDSYIGSVVGYASAVWGFHKGDNCERLHLDYCKRLLGVKKSTCSAMVYTELGRVPLKYVRMFNIIKYWSKLLITDNCILQCCYRYFYDNVSKCSVSNWAYHVKCILTSIGFGNVWQAQELPSSFLPAIKQRIYDQAFQVVRSQLSISSKCTLYVNLTDTYSLQFYLRKCIPPLYKRYITKFRLSSHNLEIESGRYHNVSVKDRLCKFCNTDIEDEFHFILKCYKYNEIRHRYIKEYYWKYPSVYKLVQLFTIQNTTQLCNLGKYLVNASRIRNM